MTELDQVDALRRAGDLDGALQLALALLEHDPYAAYAHDVLARVYVARGDLVRAADEWEMTVRLDPTNHHARRGLAYLALQRGQLDDAERHLDEGGESSEDSIVRRRIRAARAASGSR
jgi:tetratricopeptide (TPR) repeat protein